MLDVASGEPVTTGLAMPHSPRWHAGRLLVLNSGTGTLEAVDPGSGRADAWSDSVPGLSRAAWPATATSRSSACRASARRPSSAASRSPRATRSSSAASASVDLDTRHDRRHAGVRDRRRGDLRRPGAAGGALRRAHRRPRRARRRASGWCPPNGRTRARSTTAATRCRTPATRRARWRRTARRSPPTRPSRPRCRTSATCSSTAAAPTEGVEHLRRAEEVEPRAVNRVMIATALPVVYDSAERRRGGARPHRRRGTGPGRRRA